MSIATKVIHWVYITCRTVALRKILLTDRRATVPPIVKTVYLLRKKSCARFGLFTLSGENPR